MKWSPEWRFHPGGQVRRASSGRILRTDRPAWIERDLSTDWTVAHRIVIQNGRPVIAETRVFPVQQRAPHELAVWKLDEDQRNVRIVPGGLPARELRKVRTEEALKVLRTLPDMELLAGSAPIPTAVAAMRTSVEFTRQGLQTLDSGTPVGRPELTDIYLARVSHQYVSFVDAGERNAVQALHRWLEQEGAGVSISAVRTHLDKAERRGLFEREKAKRGKATGHMTQAGVELLASHPDRNEPLHDIRTSKGRKA